ncbi:TOMM precursor leader peptide-binding protein [Amycolatopsis sp. H20-H5]|uniref:TOMM precursor leader peptide-binding protein n=1 Tax=Amycolatopsis sp. H20-H5 TaxID=3046309 RepID=UPI002DBDEE7E|nr:TOMM precursor leader peptide-binding protein [Amycolatopsis sp. H20-H5]MEC3975185.1 TOMM precursor leader peptide-binding protein [Amycolatopsis sp. H20-H5]
MRERGEVTEGGSARFLDFKRHLRAEINDGDGAYLFSERGVIAMRGAQIAALAALLDGTHDLAGVLRARPAGMSEEQIAGLLAQLVEADLVTLRTAEDAGADERELAYWDACGVDTVAARERTSRVQVVAVGEGTETAQVERALRDAGLEIGDDDSADLTVVLCDDYLDLRLGEIDAAHRASRTPWLLAKPTGSQVWLGPILRPGDSACWHCLSNRLWGHRHPEACVQATLGRVGPASAPVSAIPALTSAAANLIALEVTKWLAGYRYPGQSCVWVLDSLDLQGKLHELRRRPQCPDCGDPSLVAARTREPVVLLEARKTSCGGGGHRTLTPSQVLERYRHLISPVTGIVGEVTRDPRSPAFVNVYRSGVNIARSVTGMAELRASLRGENGGKGATPLDAEVGALCEAVERYSGDYQGDELRVRGSLRGLGADAVHPNECMLYAGQQYRDRRAWNAAHAAFQHVCEPFDEDAELDWTPMWSLTSQRQRLLPTGLLYYGVPGDQARGLRADSNGTAAGSSLEDAILQGLLELVERDAVALWWYNRTPVPGVDLRSFGDHWLEETIGQYAELGRELWALDVTSDLGVPVMVAVSRSVTGERERIMFGFGAHLDPRLALRRAVSELNQMLPVVLDDHCSLDDPDAVRWLEGATVASQPYVLPVGGVPARTPADFRFTHRADVSDDVRALVSALAERGMETLVLDQTRPDVALPVVKVLVPGLRSFWARFAPGRLFDVPVRLGRLDRPTGYEGLNPFPLFL